MLLWIPEHVSFQVKTAYTMHLNDKLVAVQATAPQTALPPLPPIAPKITPGKADKPVTETLGSNQGKRKASGTPARSQQDIAIPVAAIAAAVTPATATAATGTSSANAVEVPDSDSDDTDDTTPPLILPKKEHGLTIILGMNINNHLKFIKSDIRIVSVKKGTRHLQLCQRNTIPHHGPHHNRGPGGGYGPPPSP
jgi:hypothetical protein